MGRLWTEKEDKYLLSHAQLSVEQLASELGRSPVAVKQRLRKKQEDNEVFKTPVESTAETFIKVRANRTKAAKPRAQSKSVHKRTAATSKWTGKGNPYAQTRTGYRQDLKIVVRSGWEANVLRVLSAYSIKWEFEPKIFQFPIKRGTKAYVPDIYLPTTDEWIEVKGYLDKKSEIKLRRFKKYYPADFARLIMIIGKSSKARDFCNDLGVPIVLYYEDFSKAYKPQLPSWEGR